MKAILSDTGIPRILFALLVLMALVTSCSDDPTSPTNKATVKGILTLPESAAGHEYAVVIDNDLDGDEQVKYTVGECSAGTEVSYSISGVAKGTYYVYALVRLVSDSDSEPEEGDLYGVYGGSLSDPPSAPNVSVPSSGTVTVNVTMDTFHVGR